MCRGGEQSFSAKQLSATLNELLLPSQNHRTAAQTAIQVRDCTIRVVQSHASRCRRDDLERSSVAAPCPPNLPAPPSNLPCLELWPPAPPAPLSPSTPPSSALPPPIEPASPPITLATLLAERRTGPAAGWEERAGATGGSNRRTRPGSGLGERLLATCERARRIRRADD